MSACFPECQCGGTGSVERGPTGATYSYPCYPWDCPVAGCRCKEREQPRDPRECPHARTKPQIDVLLCLDCASMLQLETRERPA